MTPEQFPRAGQSMISGDVTIVIPIFNAHDCARACVESVLRHSGPETRIILVDDASTDARIRPMIEAFARGDSRIATLLHEINQGYTRSVNDGCRRVETDVIILNSDAVVTPRWIEKLRRTAYGRVKVATVTPLSNAAGAFSVPKNNVVNEVPASMSVDDVAAIVERLSERIYPDAPTGNGFCMYITRAAIDAVGLFDEEAFPRGYGEENDFCMRARAAGFIHLIDDATYVFHKRNASFGEEKTALMAAGRKIVDERHPIYKSLVEIFGKETRLNGLRERLSRVLAAPARARKAAKPRLSVLSVVHAGGGGTILTNQDLMAGLSEYADCYVLSCGPQKWQLHAADAKFEPVQEFKFAKPLHATEIMGADRRGALAQIFSECDIDVVHVRSILGAGPEIVPFAKSTGRAVVMSFHDFLAVCPTIQLLDEKLNYCEGRCTPGAGACGASKKWFPELADLKHQYVYDWRRRVGLNLAEADAFVTTSEAAASVLRKHFWFLRNGRLKIIEHGRDRENFRPIAEPPSRTGPVRVVAMGAMGPAKGIHLISRLMELNRQNGGPFEFHILGAKATGWSPENEGAIWHGPYQRGDLAEKLAAIRPSFSLVASLWPETYCHTLTESWLAGIPVFASDIGVLRERVLKHGGGWLLDHNDPEEWYERMIEIATDTDQWDCQSSAIKKIAFTSMAAMAMRYFELYQEASRLGSRNLVQ